MYNKFGLTMARKTKEDTENTRNLILQSALDCFYEKGFSKTGFEDIARPLGLTKGAVYWHFKNKTELLAAIIRQKAANNRREIGQEHVCPANIKELRNFFRREAEYIERSKEVQKFFFFTIFQVEWSDASLKQVMKEIGEINDFHFKTVKEALTLSQKSGEIAPSVNIDTIALIIVSAWRGMINAYVNKQTDFSLSEVFLEGLDTMIDRIETKKG